jgi:hypothetical protein
MAENEGISSQKRTRGRYFKPKRELLKKQLGHFIITECLSNREIAERCGAPISTVEKWIREFYKERNQELIDATSPEAVLTAMNRSRDRLERHRKRMIEDLESEQYKDAPLSDKAALWGLVCELELIDVKMVESAPEILARSQGLPNGYSLPELMSKDPEPIEFTPHVPFLFKREDDKKK